MEKFEARDCDPVGVMIDMIEDAGTEPAIRARLVAEAVSYIYPKRKALEIKDDRTGGSDFLMVREMLAHYRNWRRQQNLPEIGALPDKCPTEPYTSSGAWAEEPAESAPAPAGRAAQTNGTCPAKIL